MSKLESSERTKKLEEIRKSIFAELEKSLEHHDPGNVVTWLLALEKVEGRIRI